MASPQHTAKPKFGFAELWGACSRCGARVRYNTLEREKLTGLLVCGPASGRPVRYCLDPWPPVYDFQAYPDRSTDPPPEPLPLRYNLDDIWGVGPSTGSPSVFAAAPKPAPDDATRLAALLAVVPYYGQLGKSAAFAAPPAPLNTLVQSLTTVAPADYDGTFLPSGSVRTVTPPSEAAELAGVSTTDRDVADKIWTPPWAAVKGV